MNASASGPMNSPCTPEMKYTGTNSATTASVAKITGERISSDASRTTSSARPRRRERRVLAQAAHDVLDVDDRVVDEHADRDREAAERHRVERVAEVVEHERRGDQRQRNRDERDQRGAHVAQEREQHDEHDHGREREAVAQIAERALDEVRGPVQRRIDRDALRP